jgi:hypothetical protein
MIRMRDSGERLDATSLTVLKTIYGLLRERGRWPTFSVVDRRLDHLGMSAQAALAAVPHVYMRHPMVTPAFRDVDEIVLTLPGVAVTGEADDDLGMLARFVQWVAQAERTHDPDETGQPLVVTSEQAAGELDFDAENDHGQTTLRRLWSLIELIRPISAGASVHQDRSRWQLTVSRDIRTYRDLSGPEDLVRRVGDYWRQMDQALNIAFPATAQAPPAGAIDRATQGEPALVPAEEHAKDALDAAVAVRPGLLEPEQEDLLAGLVEASRRVPRNRRGSFLLEQVQEGSYLMHPGLDDWRLPCHPGDVRVLDRLGLVVAEDDEEPQVDVTPQGLAYVEQVRHRLGGPLRPIREAADSYTGAEREASPDPREKAYDVFICHAGEDKDSVARPLANALRALGLAVWFDEFELKIGDSLRRRIDDGLTRSRFGVVVLSPAFFARRWPKRELDGLVTRQMAVDTPIILPIWHDVTHDEVMQFSPPLADTLARTTRDIPIADIATEIARVARD